MRFFYDEKEVPIWFQIFAFALASAVAPFILAAIIAAPWVKIIPYLIGCVIGVVPIALYLIYRRR